MEVSDGYKARMNACNLNHIYNINLFNKTSFIFIILRKLYYSLMGCHALLSDGWVAASFWRINWKEQYPSAKLLGITWDCDMDDWCENVKSCLRELMCKRSFDCQLQVSLSLSSIRGIPINLWMLNVS